MYSELLDTTVSSYTISSNVDGVSFTATDLPNGVSFNNGTFSFEFETMSYPITETTVTITASKEGYTDGTSVITFTPKQTLVFDETAIYIGEYNIYNMYSVENRLDITGSGEKIEYSHPDGDVILPDPPNIDILYSFEGELTDIEIIPDSVTATPSEFNKFSVEGSTLTVLNTFPQSGEGELTLKIRKDGYFDKELHFYLYGASS